MEQLFDDFVYTIEWCITTIFLHPSLSWEWFIAVIVLAINVLCYKYLITQFINGYKESFPIKGKL